MVLTDKEQDADEVWKRRVDGLQGLLENMLLLLGTRDEVCEPKSVECRKFLQAVCVTNPFLPQVEVFVVGHAALSLHKSLAFLRVTDIVGGAPLGRYTLVSGFSIVLAKCAAHEARVSVILT